MGRGLVSRNDAQPADADKLMDRGEPAEQRIVINDYMAGLGRYKPGDKVEVMVRRDGKEATLEVTLGSRPSE